MSLAERVAAADLAGLPDWRVAELLNSPDPSLPEVVTLEQTLLGPAGIMVALGPEAGARVLNAIEAGAMHDAKLRWVFYILKDGGVDMAHVFVRSGLDDLASAAIITATDAQILKATAERRRFPSWAEHNQIEVTARSVGLARGAVG
jgi:hypothetical protein